MSNYTHGMDNLNEWVDWDIARETIHVGSTNDEPRDHDPSTSLNR